jgi:hypothetical protein
MSLPTDNASVRRTKRESNAGNVRVFAEMRGKFWLRSTICVYRERGARLKFIPAILEALKPEINEIAGICCS